MTSFLKKFAVVCLALGAVQTSTASANTLAWTQHQNPQTSTNDITAAFRNPAGMSFMDPGFYFNFTGQVIWLDRQSTATELTGPYAGNHYGPKLTGFAPYVSAGWTGERWSFFGFTHVYSGSPDAVSFDPALLDLSVAGLGWQEAKLDVISAIFTYNLGVSYKVTDTLAVSFVSALATRIDDVEVEFKNVPGTAAGEGLGTTVGLQVGAAYKPNDDWFFSLGGKSPIKVKSYINLESLQEQSGDLGALASGIAVDTINDTIEIPWKLFGGARYSLTPDWSVSGSFLLEFWDVTEEKARRNLYAVAVGTEVQVTDMLDLSAGAGVATPDTKPGYITPNNPPTPGFTFSGGAGLSFLDNHKLDVGATLSTRENWDTPNQGFVDAKAMTLLLSMGYTLHI